MSKPTTSYRKMLATAAVSGLLIAGLGACQDQGRTPPNEPAKNPPSQPSSPGQSQGSDFKPVDQKLSGGGGQRSTM